MKRFFLPGVLIAVLLTLPSQTMLFVQPAGATHKANHPPSGYHYNLNIIAVPPNNRPSDSNDSSRHTIFVPLNTVKGNVDCRILLQQGTFQVVDGFCLDGDARFQLPDPDPDANGVVEYQVWIALAGKPNGGMQLTTCVETITGTFCSLETVVRMRGTGKPQWSNVTKELLTVCADTDFNNVCDTRIFLFDEDGLSYWWDYDNFGNRLAKLRFYPIQQNIGTIP